MVLRVLLSGAVVLGLRSITWICNLYCRPETVEDIQKAVEVHDAVVPLGEGHSWNKVRMDLVFLLCSGVEEPVVRLSEWAVPVCE